MTENGNAEVRVAIYCRLSEEDRIKKNAQDDSMSIQNQKSMLISFAEANGWSIYKVYSDDDYTGADRNRPAFNELIREAGERKFQIVLCKSQSRFTREMEMVEHYLHDLFPLWGIRFIGLVDNADTAVAGNKKSRQINGLVNEWYLEDLSENIKKTLTDRRQKGFHIGAFCAYGYQKDPDKKGHLLPDPEAAAIVHRIFEMYASGMGRSAIAKKLNQEGIPNPTEYKLQHGIRWNRTSNSPTSRLWQYFSVSEVLANEVYIGNLVQGKYESISYKTHKSKPTPRERWIRVEGTHEPIIERELWDKVQQIRQSRTKPGWTGRVGIFAGKCKCMYCGATMQSGRADSCGQFYRCKTHKLNPAACQGAFITVDNLTAVIRRELRAIIYKYLDYDTAENQLELRDDSKKRKLQLKKMIAQEQDRLNKLANAIRVLYMDRTEGVISVEEYRSISAGYREEAELGNRRLEAAQRQLEELEKEKELTETKREILAKYVDISEVNYDMVNTLIDYVEIGKRQGHYRHYEVPVTIHWRF